MVAPNIFQPRINWNVKSMRCKKRVDLVTGIAAVIKAEIGIDPLSVTRYRGGDNVKARQLFFSMLVKYTGKSYMEIGKYLNKDHSTVSHSLMSVQNQMETSKSFRDLHNSIDNKVKYIK